MESYKVGGEGECEGEKSECKTVAGGMNRSNRSDKAKQLVKIERRCKEKQPVEINQEESPASPENAEYQGNRKLGQPFGDGIIEDSEEVCVGLLIE